MASKKRERNDRCLVENKKSLRMQVKGNVKLKDDEEKGLQVGFKYSSQNWAQEQTYQVGMRSF